MGPPGCKPDVEDESPWILGWPTSMHEEQCNAVGRARSTDCLVLRCASLRSVAAVQPNAKVHSPSLRVPGWVEAVMLLCFPSRLRPCASAGEVRFGPQTEEVKALIQRSRRKRIEGTCQMLRLMNGPSLVGLARYVCACAVTFARPRGEGGGADENREEKRASPGRSVRL